MAPATRTTSAASPQASEPSSSGGSARPPVWVFCRFCRPPFDYLLKVSKAPTRGHGCPAGEVRKGAAMRYLMFVCTDPSAEQYDPKQDNIESWVSEMDGR